MSAPTAAPAGATALARSFRSMGSDVELRVLDPGPHADACLDRAEHVVRQVARHLTRFDPTSALSRANAAPGSWHRVPGVLAAAVEEAERAHRETAGRFDPRVLASLLDWGYDRSLPFRDGGVATTSTAGRPAAARPLVDAWRPRTSRRARSGRGSVLHLGGRPVDLGGIGKGLAVRWAATELAGAGRSFVVDAGGDEYVGGPGPSGDGWRIGVEDPLGRGDVLLVLSVRDAGCATSSSRRLRWTADGVPVHHLVDPRTGLPGGQGLASVTVVAPDAAWAEVWSKTLFLAGDAGIRDEADGRGLAAAWVGADGRVSTSSAMDPLVVWRRDDGKRDAGARADEGTDR